MGLMSFMEILEIILEAIFFLAIQFRSQNKVQIPQNHKPLHLK